MVQYAPHACSSEHAELTAGLGSSRPGDWTRAPSSRPCGHRPTPGLVARPRAARPHVRRGHPDSCCRECARRRPTSQHPRQLCSRGPPRPAHPCVSVRTLRRWPYLRFHSRRGCYFYPPFFGGGVYSARQRWPRQPTSACLPAHSHPVLPRRRGQDRGLQLHRGGLVPHHVPLLREGQNLPEPRASPRKNRQAERVQVHLF